VCACIESDEQAHCNNTLQHTAPQARVKRLMRVYVCVYTLRRANTLPHPATHCNTPHCNILQHRLESTEESMGVGFDRVRRASILQHTATDCYTLQHRLESGEESMSVRLDRVRRANTLQRTAIHCNTLQHRLE